MSEPIKIYYEFDKDLGDDECCSPDYTAHAACGSAVDYSYLDDGFMWVSNGEYASLVTYCPFCGKAGRSPKEYEES